MQRDFHLTDGIEPADGATLESAKGRFDDRPELDPSDHSLLRRLRAADGDALTVLYDRYAATVHGLTRSILRDDRLAEEATHDVFLNLWKNPDAYDSSRGPFAGWLFRVARNRAIDLLRRRREQPFGTMAINDDGDPVDPASFLVDTDPDPADQAVSTLQREAVRAAMRRLSEDHRHLLELAYFTGMTQSEIASHLNRPLGTVKTQIRAAMRRLAEFMKETSTDEGASRVVQAKGRAEERGNAATHLYGELPGAVTRP